MIARSFALLIIWIALWGELNLANVITGVLVITALTMLFSGLRRREHKIRVLPAISFFFYMLRSIVASSWDIIVAVLFPTEQRRHSEIVRVRLRSTSKLVRAITANTISLTPGTVIVSINSDTAMMEIHVLGKTDSAEFQQAIHDHEDRVTAFIVEKT
jgi:multicomponent Na+:H+ antiporter subunit E